MKTLKKVTGMFLAFCLCIGAIVVLAPVSAQAATSTAKAPTKVHITTGSLWEEFTVQYQDPGDSIKIESTGGKNMAAKVIYSSTSSYEAGSGRIAVYAKKNGTYSLKYSLYNKAGKKVKTFTTKVKADANTPIKKATYAGKMVIGNKYTYNINSPKKSGKLVVTMAKGYKLKKITVTTYDKNGKAQTKTVKNKSKITLGKYPYKYESISGEGDSYYEYTSRSMYIDTTVTVTYVDNFTKEEKTRSFNLNQYAKN